MNISRFSTINALGIKFDRAINLVKVNLALSFEQTWWGPHPQYYIPIPKAIGLLVPENKIFKGVLLYIGVVAILVI